MLFGGKETKRDLNKSEENRIEGNQIADRKQCQMEKLRQG